MLVPTLQVAEILLNEADGLNPGPWVSHSRWVARAAHSIASALPAMDASTAYVMGLLHDIGRRQGVHDMRHILDGYHFVNSLGYTDAARICLTHAYPIPIATSYAGEWDVSGQDLQFVQDFLDSIEYTSYDRLIQLCDGLALPSGFCLLEKRLVDVALRRGVNGYSAARWKAYLQIQDDFEAQLGCSIYDLLPGVVENTFTKLLI